MNPLVSILIPFFNEEKYILKAIHSCLVQTYQNIEIILVDDFSTDSSLKLIANIKDSRIKLRQSPNKGVGFARNTALNEVQGEYFAFLDADDELEKEFVNTCLIQIQMHNCDIAVFGTKVFDRDKSEINKEVKISEPEVISGKEALEKLYSYDIIASVWAKLFRTDLVKDIEFGVGFVFEDKPFMIELFLTAKRVCVNREQLYLHFANPNSITRSTLQNKRIQDSTVSFFVEINILERFKINEKLLQLSFNYQINIMVDVFLMIWMDRKKTDFKKLHEVFLQDLKKIIEKSRALSLSYTFKRRILLSILSSSKTIGVRIPFAILKTYFNSQYKFIKKIKA
jgi:glycosyltransferase involved in cell wall biosynthesis